jgi:hypothetical protein
MGLLDRRQGLIVGMPNERAISWSIAQALIPLHHLRVLPKKGDHSFPARCGSVSPLTAL